MCVFCDIVSGKQESDIVFRKKTHVAFLDIAPINEGHILIVPALHVDNLIDLPDDIWMDMTNSARDIIAALCLTYNNKGYTVWQLRLRSPASSCHPQKSGRRIRLGKQ